MTKEARQAGDGLLVLTNQGQRVAGSGMPAGNWDEFSLQANDEAQLPLGNGQPVQPITEVIGSEVIAAMPIYSQAKTKEPWIGTVLLARSTQPLEHEILELWVILGSIAVAAMIAAAVLGFALARWVSRPLKSLDTAARKAGRRGPRDPGQGRVRARESCAAWAPRSTPWPGGWRHWCTGAGR